MSHVAAPNSQHANMRRMVQKNARPPQHTGAHRGPQSHSLRLAVIVCPTRTHARGRVYTLQMCERFRKDYSRRSGAEATAATGARAPEP